jgi:energy-coupling factor transporter ATP-binding protein EcfA2
LGTRDKTEAEQFRDELNQLLAEPRYRDPAARAEAEQRFDPRVVDIYFHKMSLEEFDFHALREKTIPLPPREPDGYRHVLLLGTTGAGKTTLVRQLIGTDPSEERFPSTSTSKTTIHDTEIILGDGPWRVIVTFVSSDEAREYLNECISAAVRTIVRDAEDATDATVLRCLLNHVNQRFRFSYILGTGPKTTTSISDFDDEDEDPEEDVGLFPTEELGVIDMTATSELLALSITRLRSLADQLRERLCTELDVSDEEGDKRALDELLEEELDDVLRENETFHEIADALMDEIEKRFDLLPPGIVTKTRQGWPLTWKGEWPVEKRREFITSISRFSSNYAPLYGRLLTPLVNGVRVAGPFSPKWKDGQTPKLVLFDGEGLGHTPKSSSSVSTGVSRLIEAADAVLLVDNAAQPMQAAPLAAIRELVATGNGRKLILAFTHFDEVKGDNLPSTNEKAQHVLASAENVLAAFGEELGPYAERILRKRLEAARFFLADLQEPLSENTGAGRRTVHQLRRLLKAIDQVIKRPQPTKACPVYDRMNLVLAIRSAARSFQEAWRPWLGLESRPGFTKEPWQRVKALNRRLAAMGKDEYDNLRPVADLRQELRDRIYVFIQSPLHWEGAGPSEEERQIKYDAFADSLGGRLLALSTRRVWRERIQVWERAYRESGRGSTFVRARIIANDIYEPAAPVPDVTPSPDRNQFLREVVAEVEAAAQEVEARLL